jgi:hypothetical protein
VGCIGTLSNFKQKAGVGLKRKRRALVFPIYDNMAYQPPLQNISKNIVKWELAS